MSRSATAPGPATAETHSLRRDVRVISLVNAAHFMSHFYQLVLPPLFVPLTQLYGVGFLEIGLVVTVFSVTTAVTQTPIGFLVDRMGARAPLILGTAALGASVACYGLAPSYEWLLLLAVIGGVANSVYHPADFAILGASVAPGRIGRAFAIHGVSGNLGWAAAPLVMLALTAWFGVQVAFLAAGAVGLLVSLILLLQRRHLTDERDHAMASAPGKAPEGTGVGDGFALLLSRTVLLLFFFQLVFAMSFGGIRNFSVAALNQAYDIPVELVAGALTAYLVGASFGNLLGGWAADKTGRPHLVFIVDVLLVAALVALIGLVPMNIVMLTILLGLCGTLQGSLLPARDVLVRQIAPKGQLGKLFGFTSAGLSLGNSITPIVFGIVMDMGEPRWVFLGSAAFMLLALATYVETRRHSEARAAKLRAA